MAHGLGGGSLDQANGLAHAGDQGGAVDRFQGQARGLPPAGQGPWAVNPFTNIAAPIGIPTSRPREVNMR